MSEPLALEDALSALESVEQQDSRIHRRMHLNLESHQGQDAFFRDIEDQQRQLGRTVGLESMEQVRSALTTAKNSGAIMLKGTVNLVEQIGAQLDSTGSQSLNLTRRKVAGSEGDLPSGETVVVDRTLADLLHVNGEVPEAPLEALKHVLATSAHLRTLVIPAIGSGIQNVFSQAFERATPKQAADYTKIADTAVQQALGVKSLLDFYSAQELQAPLVGGYRLCYGVKQDASVQADKSVQGAEAKLQAKLTKLHSHGIVLNQKPTRHRMKADSFQVTLLGRADIEHAMNLAAKLIGEGQGLRAASKRLGKTTGQAIAQSAKWVKELGQEEKTIEAEDVRKLELVQAFFQNSLVQHHQILTTMAVILFQTAKAYLALVEKSAQHYK